MTSSTLKPSPWKNSEQLLKSVRLWKHAKAKLSRNSLEDFLTFVYPWYHVAHHHRQIIEKLEAVERGDITRLIITMPPRHSKSQTASIGFPSWFMGRNPDMNVTIASYSGDLAHGFGSQIKEVLRDEAFQLTFPGITSKTRSSDTWGIDGRRGRFRARGVRGSLTGTGAHLLITDDPLKDWEEANSESLRQKVWDWFTSVAMTRLAPGGRVVVIATRWHRDDLIGRLMEMSGKAGADTWEVLGLPAIANESDPDQSHWQALWPEMFPLDYLIRLKNTVGPKVWRALYQCDPVAAEGNIFKRDWLTRRYNPAYMPLFQKKVMTVDSAWKTGVYNDWTVMQVWGTDGVDYYLVDEWRKKVEFHGIKTAVKDMFAKHIPDVVLVEDKASGIGVIQELIRETGIPVLAYPTDDRMKQISKVARAETTTPIWAMNKVLLPEGTTWVSDYVEEMCSFPAAKNDDRVDTSTMAIDYLKVPSLERVGVMNLHGARSR